jgi:hypothetical protein
MEEAYQLSLKANENINLQFSQRNRGERSGTSTTSWGGFNYGRGETYQRDEQTGDTRQGN